jgi:hypothetical protein
MDEVGTKLYARYKGETHTAELVEKEGAKLYRLSDGREFKSPSAAGTAITGKACKRLGLLVGGRRSREHWPGAEHQHAGAAQFEGHAGAEATGQATRAQDPDGGAARRRGPGWRRGARRRAPSRAPGMPGQ